MSAIAMPADLEPTIGAMLERQISTLEANINRRLDTTDKNVAARFDRQDQQLKEIKEQTQRTNGRVTVLEKARERTQGVIAAYSWVPLVAASAVTAGFTVLVMVITRSMGL